MVDMNVLNFFNKEIITSERVNNENIDLKKVYEFARDKHEGQYRADGNDYIVHPLRVAKIIFENKESKELEVLIAAALLHDVIEDTRTCLVELGERFGEMVASLVLEVTSASFAIKLLGKAVYLEQKMNSMTNYALCIKLADRLDNLRDSDTLSEERRTKLFSDTRRIMDYLNKNRTFTASQRRIAQQINELLNKANF
ncbi:MAG: HD domain-containing protein [Clostridia bacterium]|nr:HD domain-containing protein [Clostridia bacterium]